jgi:hypothetical protein
VAEYQACSAARSPSGDGLTHPQASIHRLSISSSPRFFLLHHSLRIAENRTLAKLSGATHLLMLQVPTVSVTRRLTFQLAGLHYSS